MNRIELGHVGEFDESNYDAFLIMEGFDVKYELEENGNHFVTCDNIVDFAEEVLMAVNPMGYNRLRGVAGCLYEKLKEIDEDALEEVCEARKISDDEIDFIK